jgi:hypothetical protein
MHLNNKHRMGYYISTATMLKRKSHNATLKVQSLSCYLVFMKFIFVTMHAIRILYSTNMVMVKKCLLKTWITTFRVTLSIQYLYIITSENPGLQTSSLGRI